MNNYFKILTSLFFILTMFSVSNCQTTDTVITNDELKLYNLITAYRTSKGLKKIPLSSSLTIVAQTHCKDLVDNKPDLPKECNSHSWSNKGTWSGCCYTKDHKAAECMWNKPKELTSYTGYGFEIAVGSSDKIFDDYIMTPEYAIKAWKESYHHNNVIINEGIWKDTQWNAIGIGIYKGYATVWFGKEKDEEIIATKE